MIKSLERAADRALSLFVPKVEAAAACPGGCHPGPGGYCSNWACCAVGTTSFFMRSCPRYPDPGCYTQFSGKC